MSNRTGLLGRERDLNTARQNAAKSAATGRSGDAGAIGDISIKWPTTKTRLQQARAQIDQARRAQLGIR